MRKRRTKPKAFQRNWEPKPNPNGPKYPIWDHVSASQIGTFLGCWRKWYFDKVLGARDKREHPAFVSGKRVHAECDSYLSTGVLSDPLHPDCLSIPKGIEQGMFPEPGEDLIIETKIDNAIRIAGVPLYGRIDLVSLRDDIIRLDDHKSSSSWDWLSPDPDKVRNNHQLLLYARYALLKWRNNGKIEIGHNQLLTRGKVGARRVSAIVDEDYVLEQWRALEQVVEQMKEVSQLKLHQVRPDRSACSKFGGCFFLSRCQNISYEPNKDKPSLIGGRMARKMKKKSSGGSSKIADLVAKRKKAAGDEEPKEETTTKRRRRSTSGRRRRKKKKTEPTFEDKVAEAVEFLKTAHELEDDEFYAAIEEFDDGVIDAAEKALDEAEEEPEEEVDEEEEGAGTDVLPPDAPEPTEPAVGLDLPIEDTNMGGRATKRLKKHGVHTLGDVVEFLADGGNIRKDIQGIGGGTLKKIEKALLAEVEVVSAMEELDLLDAFQQVDEEDIEDVLEDVEDDEEEEVEDNASDPAPPRRRSSANTSKPAAEGALTVLLIDCAAIKGLDENTVLLEHIIADLAREVEVELSRPWYAMENFFEARDLMSGLLFERADDLVVGHTIVVRSSGPVAGALLDVLVPLADVVVKG